MQRFEGQSLREFLHPLEAALAATDADPKAIFHTGCGLCDPETSTGAVIKSEQSPGKIIYHAVGNDGSYSRQRLRPLPDPVINRVRL